MISLVNSHENAISNRWHLWEIKNKIALKSTAGWDRGFGIDRHAAFRCPPSYFRYRETTEQGCWTHDIQCINRLHISTTVRPECYTHAKRCWANANSIRFQMGVGKHTHSTHPPAIPAGCLASFQWRSQPGILPPLSRH